MRLTLCVGSSESTKNSPQGRVSCRASSVMATMMPDPEGCREHCARVRGGSEESAGGDASGGERAPFEVEGVPPTAVAADATTGGQDAVTRDDERQRVRRHH